jgi:hypothetical protein
LFGYYFDGPAILALGGPVLTSGLHAGLSDIDALLWGAIVAISFCPPMSAHFDKAASGK